MQANRQKKWIRIMAWILSILMVASGAASVLYIIIASLLG